MADSKVQDLGKRVLSSLANLTGVRLWSGKTGEANALGIEASEFISSAVVADDSIDYKALTPKGFNTSIMTETRRGVGTYAGDTDINAKTGEGLLRSSKQSVMQAQWKKDFFEVNSVPNTYRTDSFSSPHAMSFDVNMYIPSVGNNTYYTLSPSLPTGKTFHTIYAHIVLKSTVSAVPRVGTYKITYASGEAYVIVDNSLYRLGIRSDGRSIFFYKNSTLAMGMSISMHVNAVMS